MVPTLNGRIQTRLFALAVIGGLVTLAVTPLLSGEVPLSQRYRATFVVLAAVAIAGVGWELVYHGLQQFRWEKDWPTLFGLLTAVNEGLLIWLLLRIDVLPTGLPVSTGDFLFLFVCVWLAVWLWLNGPMRVPFLRWRFNGGRLL